MTRKDRAPEPPSERQHRSTHSKSQRLQRAGSPLQPHKHKEEREKEFQIDQCPVTLESLRDEEEKIEKKINGLEYRTLGWNKCALSIVCRARDWLQLDNDLEILISTYDLENAANSEDSSIPGRFLFTGRGTLGALASQIRERVKEETRNFYETFVLGHNIADNVSKKAPTEQLRRSTLKDNRIRNFFECIRLFAEKEDWDGLKRSLASLDQVTRALDKVLYGNSYQFFWECFDRNVSDLSVKFQEIKSKLSLLTEDKGNDCTSTGPFDKLMSELKSLDAKADWLRAEQSKIDGIRRAFQIFNDEMKKPVILWKERHPEESPQGPKTSKHPDSRRDSATGGSQDRVKRNSERHR